MFQILGMTGIAISAAAYVPQVVHLGMKHCSVGVSPFAWAMWLISAVFVGSLAVHRHDVVFIVLQATGLTAATTILFLTHKYRGCVCESHANLAES